MRFARRAADILLGCAVFGVAWALRAVASATFVTWDEPAWVYRSVAFLQALARGDLAGTLQVGHPGVLTMWSGAVSLVWHRAVTGLVRQSQLEAIAAAPWRIHDAALLKQLGALLPLARAAMPLLHAGLLAVSFTIVRRLAGRWPAVLAAALLLGDPFALAHGRVLHLDALAAEALLATTLALLLYARDGCRRHLALAGALWGLALLNKSTSALLLPAAVAMLVGRVARQPVSHRVRHGVIDVALWAGAAALTCLALWPALWVAPKAALQSVLGLSVQYGAQEAGATTGFFLGEMRADAGPAFYPVAVWYRATPLALLGATVALVAVLGCRRQRPAQRPSSATSGPGDEGDWLAGWLLVTALVYGALLSLALKKFDRYALPCILMLDVAAALGLLRVLRLVRGLGWLGVAVPALGALAQAIWLLLPLAPAHYLAYYNPLAGGLRAAMRALPVGWGEGVEQAAAYLAAEPGAQGRTVATWAVAGIAPAFPGSVVPLMGSSLPQADRLVLTVSDVQSPDDVAAEILAARAPVWVGRLRGEDYVYVYNNDYGAGQRAVIQHGARAGDLAVSNLPSTIQRDDRSAATWAEIEGADDRAIASALGDMLRAEPAAQEPRQVFYLALNAEAGTTAAQRGEALARLLATNGLLLSETPGEYGPLRIYRLLDHAITEVAPDHEAGALFGDRLALEAHGLVRDAVQYRQEAGVALRWRAAAPTDRDLHVSLQIVDDDGNVWGQRDLPLRDEAGRGTSVWAAGEPVTTRATVPPAAGIPPGRYALRLRVYALEDLRPLPVKGAQVSAEDTAWMLAPLVVAPASVQPTDAEITAEQRTALRLDGRLTVLGYTLAPASLCGGERATLTLFWRWEQADQERYLLSLSLRRKGESVEMWRGDPAGEGYPTPLWHTGEVLRYPHRLTVPTDLDAGSYGLTLSLLAAATGEAVGEPVELGQITISQMPRLWQVPALTHVQEATFGEAIALRGYEVSPAPTRGGDLRVTLCWQALGEPPSDYVVFVHLLDSQGRLVAQHDGVPDAGQRPTGGWLAGEVILDGHTLAVPATLASGEYRLEVGLYDAATGKRLRVTTAAGVAIPEKSLALGQPIVVR